MIAIHPGSGAIRSNESGGLISDVDIEVEGDAGFARATVAVETSNPGHLARTALYDALFLVQGRVRFLATATKPLAEGGSSRVLIRAESSSENSEIFVEPRVPFLEPGARVSLEPLIVKDQTIQGGHEVEVARWEVQSGPETSKVTVRILFSRKPTGPRLKPEARPPV